MPRFAHVCTSHSPLLNVAGAAPADIEAEIRLQTAKVARFVSDFEPDLIVQFGDDHASGFNLSLMPAFCVGIRANAIGDFATSAGPVLTDEASARTLITHLHDAGVDVAFSYRMSLDHGFVQALDLLIGGIDRVPVVPVMINCGGDLRPPMSRVAALGRAIGQCLQGIGDRRVLLLGSGGLSHDPPLPEFMRSPPDVQARIIEGVVYTPDLLRERTQRVHRAAIDFATNNTSSLLPLDAAWDRQFLDRVLAGDFETLLNLGDDEVRNLAGRGGAEIRNWLAALVAMQAANGGKQLDTQLDYYRAVPELICGYAIVHGVAHIDMR